MQASLVRRLPAVLPVLMFLLSAAPALAVTRLAHIEIGGSITEAPGMPGFSLSLSVEKSTTLRDLCGRITKAADDGKIDGLLITWHGADLGGAQASELRRTIENFRKSGKKVYLHAESLALSDYVVATAADRIVLLPGGDVDLHGMATELTHFKGLLDTIGVHADFVRSGKYKSAVEPMLQKKPSEATLEMMNRILDDLYGNAVKSIAAGRKLTEEQVRKIIDDGPYTAEEARDLKLVDALADRESFRRSLDKEVGGNLTVVDDYGVQKAGPEIDFNNPFAIFKLLGEIMGGKKEPAKDPAPKLAIIYAEGAITSGESGSSMFGGSSLGSDTFNKAVKEAREDASVKAVVIRIDSPGGSALASEAMWRELKLLAEKKRVIVSMGNVAASGGYYIASAAETIVAEPTTITGSIGVFGGKMVLKGLYDKLDIQVERLSRGANAGIYSSSTTFSDSERKVVERMIGKVYDTFLDRVAAGRNMEKAAVDKVGQGRVWTGLAAKEVGLVDELGGLDRALAIAADKAGLRDYKVRILPEPKNFLDTLMESLMGGASVKAGSKAGLVQSAVAASPEVRALLATMPKTTAPLRRFLGMLEMMERDRVMMALPPVFEIK